jgi:hypothetical protein
MPECDGYTWQEDEPRPTVGPDTPSGVSTASALRPGRWLVEVGEDGYVLWSRIGPDDKAHGG